MLITYEVFLDYLKEWVVRNEAKIASAWPQKGGWEEWAKTDLLSFIFSKNSTYEIKREQPVFQNNKEKADFLLNYSYTDAKDKVIIEMKCQSFENYKKYSGELIKDIEKLKYISPDYQGATLLCVGLYFTEHGGDIPSYFDKQVLGTTKEIGMCLAIDLG